MWPVGFLNFDIHCHGAFFPHLKLGCLSTKIFLTKLSTWRSSSTLLQTIQQYSTHYWRWHWGTVETRVAEASGRVRVAARRGRAGRSNKSPAGVSCLATSSHSCHLSTAQPTSYPQLASQLSAVVLGAGRAGSGQWWWWWQTAQTQTSGRRFNRMKVFTIYLLPSILIQLSAFT